MTETAIYLDNNATTPLDPRVLEAMLPHLRSSHGNPSCGHAMGLASRKILDEARQKVGDILGAAADEVIFTSGGSEANNLAIKGILRAGNYKGQHILISAVEHPSVVLAAKQLEREGFTVDEIPVDGGGIVTQEALAAAVRPDTVLISIMHAQNEVGAVNNILELAEVIGNRRIILHTDAAQSVGKFPTSFPLMGPNLMTLAAHKFHGPKGIGALLVNRGLKLDPIIAGAPQERGRRAGTENLAAIVGMAKALELASGYELSVQGETNMALRDYLHMSLAERLPGVVLNGPRKQRLPNTANLSFLGISSAELADGLGEVIVGTGSACHDRSGEVSPSFRAMGLGADRAGSSLRLSISRDNTVEEIDRAVELIVARVEALRKAAGCRSFEASAGPICPRCELGLRVQQTEGGPIIRCLDDDCRHILPLPGTQPPE